MPIVDKAIFYSKLYNLMICEFPTLQSAKVAAPLLLHFFAEYANVPVLFSCLTEYNTSRQNAESIY